MNREIEFRAWDFSKKCWIDPEKLVIRIDGLAIFDREIGEELHNVELLQYIGIKDKNGKKIFEGDILGVDFEGTYIGYCEKCCSYQVFWLYNKECAACDGDINWYELLDKELEVIGNIFENPELLEEYI